MSGKQGKTRKRTRSKKGQAYDEMMLEAKSPKVKEAKRGVKPKPKASQKIVFNSESDQEQVNNNASFVMRNREIQNDGLTAKNIKKDKSGKTVVQVHKTGVFDPCFKNVLQKELAMEKNSKQAKKAKIVKDNKSLLQEKEISHRDGIHLDVDGDLEELDYVDDVVDDKDLSDFGDEMVEMETVNHDKQTPLSGATQNMMMQQSN